MDKLEVPGKFDRAARGYDFLVGINPGYHQALRLSARALGLRPGMRVLDLGCGTGPRPPRWSRPCPAWRSWPWTHRRA